MKLIIKRTIDEVRFCTNWCQNAKHTQQVAYSTYHDKLTQVCFTCKAVRTNITGLK